MRSISPRRAITEAAAVVVVTVLAWLLTKQDAVGSLRAAAGLALAFVLPGYAAAGALFGTVKISRIERAVVATCMSLGFLIIGGILVFVGGARLTSTTWSALTAIATVVLTVIGLGRWFLVHRVFGTMDDLHKDDIEPAPSDELARPSRWRIAARLAPFLLVLVFLGGASWVGWQSATKPDKHPFTALSMILTDDHNTTDKLRPVALAVECEEKTRTSYTLTVHGPSGTLIKQYAFTLQPGQIWKESLEVSTTESATADLFRSTDAAPYRSVFVSGQLEQ